MAIQQTVPEESTDDPAANYAVDGDGARQIDWSSMPGAIVAWVEVPGTSIDEPIAQAGTNWPNRYLYEDALGQGSCGTPYIDCDCTPESPFVIVYGHHMSDGGVFADFAKFNDEVYAREHQTIYVYTRADNQRHECRVKAVDVVNASRETLCTSFNDDESRIACLNDRLARCDLVLDGHTITDENIWAFVTCSYQTTNSRTVIYTSELQADLQD